MPGLSILENEWVVVCDGAKALVLQNDGDARSPNLKTIEVFEQKAQPTRELGTDAPGRSHAAGHIRTTFEQTDWHDQAEQEFLTRLVRHLGDVLGADKTRSVIMVAPPRALGMLRSAYSETLKNAIRAELDKDLVKMPVYEIEKRLLHH